jgi:hypothetical protein
VRRSLLLLTLLAIACQPSTRTKPPDTPGTGPARDTVFVIDTVVVSPPPDTVVVEVPGPADTVIVETPGDTVVVELPPDTVVVQLPPDTVLVPVPPDTVIVEVPGPTDTVLVQLPPDTVFVVDTVYVPTAPPTEPGYNLFIEGAADGLAQGDSTNIELDLTLPFGGGSVWADSTAPFPDSVIFLVDGERFREQRYPYEVNGSAPYVIVASDTLAIEWWVHGCGLPGQLDCEELYGASYLPLLAGSPPEPPDNVSPGLEAVLDVDHRTEPLPSKYEQLYRYWMPQHHERQLVQDEKDPPNGWALTYYDRGFAGIGMGTVLGDQQFIDWGVYSVTEYRDRYVLPNDGGVTPRWAFPEGLTAHHYMTGDESSKLAVTKMADRLRTWIDGHEDILDTQYRDGRIQGRAILTQTMAYLLTGEDVYREGSQAGIDRLMIWFDAAGSTGRWDSGALPGSNGGWGAYCDGMATFQMAHSLLHAIRRHHQLIAPVDRIEEIYSATLDFMWQHWVPDEGFRYLVPAASLGIPAGGHYECKDADGATKSATNPAVDLSNMIANAYFFGHRLTGEQRHLDRGNEAMAHGLSGTITHPTPYLYGSKQFNENFYRLWQHAEEDGT